MFPVSDGRLLAVWASAQAAVAYKASVCLGSFTHHCSHITSSTVFSLSWLQSDIKTQTVWYLQYLSWGRNESLARSGNKLFLRGGKNILFVLFIYAELQLPERFLILKSAIILSKYSIYIEILLPSGFWIFFFLVAMFSVSM